MSELTKLKGIGPKCAERLNQIGIETVAQFREIGAMEAYLKIMEDTDCKEHIAYLYTFVGALEDRDWREVAKNEKARLAAELEGLKESGIFNPS